MFLNPVFERVDNRSDIRVTEYITLHIIVMFNDQFRHVSVACQYLGFWELFLTFR